MGVVVQTYKGLILSSFKMTKLCFFFFLFFWWGPRKKLFSFLSLEVCLLLILKETKTAFGFISKILTEKIKMN